MPPSFHVKYPLDILRDADKLKDRLYDASRSDLVEMVTDLYAVGRWAAAKAEQDADQLKHLIDVYQQLHTAQARHVSHLMRIKDGIETKSQERRFLGYKINTLLWEALGAFNDEDAARQEAAEKAAEEAESSDEGVALEKPYDDKDNADNVLGNVTGAASQGFPEFIDEDGQESTMKI
ncbi:MAG: hypothetical protein Q9170_001467 [Blastenia crenularia]